MSDDDWYGHGQGVDSKWIEDMAALVFTVIVLVVACAIGGGIYWMVSS